MIAAANSMSINLETPCMKLVNSLELIFDLLIQNLLTVTFAGKSAMLRTFPIVLSASTSFDTQKSHLIGFLSLPSLG
jgi:hypothetical protein